MPSGKALPTASVFGDMGKYWAEIADANATEKQLALVKSVFMVDSSLVLDLGCGTGRHAVPLCMAGYGMVGLDFSRDLLKLAKQSAANAGVCCEFVRADMSFMPFRSGVFAGVVSLDTSFGYSLSEEGDLQALRETKRVLVSDGQLLMDVFNGKRVVQRYGHRFSYRFESRVWSFLMRSLARFPKIGCLAAGLFKWREYPDFYLLQKRMVNSKFGELQDLWLLRGKQDRQMHFFVHIVRLYDLPRMQNMFKQAGLHLKQIYGNYKMEQYTETSSRLITITQ